MWRQQVRAALTTDAGGVAVEIAVDFAKVFENARRDLLLHEAVELGYPPALILASLRMYAMQRRFVVRGCIGKTRVPRRGIGAGSAFATREMVIVMARSMERLECMHRAAIWNVQVDDVAATV